MTNEEIIAILEGYKKIEDNRTEDLLHHGYDNTKEATKRKEALDEAIKALSVPKREKGILEGEYINKAELIKRMLGHINRFAEEKNFSMNEGLKYAQGVIVGMPTFSVPKREKGEWIEKEMFDGDTAYECSECGELFCLITGTPADNLYNFCPNCGADLRGGNE